MDELSFVGNEGDNDGDEEAAMCLLLRWSNEMYAGRLDFPRAR
jgi:hypothetical protein